MSAPNETRPGAEPGAWMQSNGQADCVGEYIPDALTAVCPRCGALAEYPDCEHCGFDFTASRPDTSEREAMQRELAALTARAEDAEARAKRAEGERDALRALLSRMRTSLAEATTLATLAEVSHG